MRNCCFWAETWEPGVRDGRMSHFVHFECFNMQMDYLFNGMALPGSSGAIHVISREVGTACPVPG